MVFRVYTKKERPQTDAKDRSIFYGWTNSKKVIKAFLSQRDPKKYRVVKMDKEEINDYFSEDRCDYENMIDTLVLHSASDNERVILFTTKNECQQAEYAIQRMFYEASSIISHNDNRLIELYLNLKDNYRESLEIIGFYPPEVEAMFSPEEYFRSGTGLDEIETEIDDAYSGVLEFPREEDVGRTPQGPLGLSTLVKTYSKLLYSLESFIKVLKEDL